MNSSAQILEKHVFFREVALCVTQLLEAHGPHSLDDLIVRSGFPSRTVILVLEFLLQNGKVLVSSGKISSPSAASGAVACGFPIARHYASAIDDRLFNTYADAASDRGPPVLLMGQRWLTPTSSMRRAQAVLSNLRSAGGTIVFLGDDDLVSPIVAKLAPLWTVIALDSDRVVLSNVHRVCLALGTRVDTIHSDVRLLASYLTDGSADVVVCDPFPSRDASFELLFWYPASRLLRNGGLLVTTARPSHKPDNYSQAAFELLDNTGFALVEIADAFGEYALFDFDLTPLEQQMLLSLRSVCSVHHTKALVSCRKCGTANAAIADRFEQQDSRVWETRFGGHYLTHQASADNQRKVFESRIPGEWLSDQSPLLEPEHPNTGLFDSSVFASILSQQGYVSGGSESAEGQSQIFNPNDRTRAMTVPLPDTRLSLALRALHSWTR